MWRVYTLRSFPTSACGSDFELQIMIQSRFQLRAVRKSKQHIYAEKSDTWYLVPGLYYY